MAAGQVELPPKPGVHPRENAFLRDAGVPRRRRCRGDQVGGRIPGEQGPGAPPTSPGVIVVNDAETGFPEARNGCARDHGGPYGRSERCLHPPLGTGRLDTRGHRRLWGAGASITRGGDDPEPSGDDPRVRRALGPCGDPGRRRGAGRRRQGRSRGRRSSSRASRSPRIRDRLSTPTASETAISRCRSTSTLACGSARSPTQASSSRMTSVNSSTTAAGPLRGLAGPHGSVGEALERKGAEAKRVACCNLGVGALDAAFARRVLDAARARRSGTRLER